MTLNTPPMGWGTSILDTLPDTTGSELLRISALCEAQERSQNADAERHLSEREAAAADRVDSAESAAFARHRQPPSHLDILRAHAAISDLEDQRAEAVRLRELSGSDRSLMVDRISGERDRAKRERAEKIDLYTQALRSREDARRRSGSPTAASRAAANRAASTRASRSIPPRNSYR